MKITKTGRLFYGISMVVFGIEQLLIKNLSPEIFPPFPAWVHHFILISIVISIGLLTAGSFIAGLFTIKQVERKRAALYLAFFFLIIVIAFHLPYILIVSPNSAKHLGVWDGAVEVLAYCGAALIMAGSFSESNDITNKNSFTGWLEKLIPLGRFFFATMLIVYGCSHFVYTDYVSPMVPKWFGMPLFWTYLAGTALICAGIAIVFKIWIKQAAFLLAIMLFLWIIFIHAPEAMANPFADHGAKIVNVFDALLFCGTALVIGSDKILSSRGTSELSEM